MKKLIIALVGAGSVALAGTAASQSPAVDDVLLQSRRISMKLRAGQYDLAPQSVAMLEAAVQTSPNDVRLWNALGTAYFQQLTASFRTGAVATIPDILRKATAAHARALALDPDDADALAGHGTGLAISSGFIRRPDLGRQGLAEMQRAVEIAPSNTLARLQRGFTNLGVSPDLRDRAAAAEDLAYLAKMTEGSRSADVLHIMLGDLAAEDGKADQARAQYAIAARAGAATQAMAAARLDALTSGRLPTAEIQALRAAPGRDCAMCHGSGPIGGISTP